MKKIYTADRKTGTFIEECKNVQEAREIIKLYEVEDKMNDCFEEDFYCVVDENHCEVR